MSDFVVLQAMAGYGVAVVQKDSLGGGPLEAGVVPVLAWKIGDAKAEPVTVLTRAAIMEGRADIPNRAGQIVVHSDGIVIQQPDGTLVSEFGKRWESLEDWLSYQKDWYRKSPPLPKAL